jgi:tetrahydromethanopterin S-methyltransferase subunit F
MTTAALSLRVFPHMKLFETTIDDVKYDHELFTARGKRGSKGVRVAMS